VVFTRGFAAALPCGIGHGFTLRTSATRALEDLDLEAGLAQRHGGGKTADAGADDYDAQWLLCGSLGHPAIVN
jgi:hypothetical protein